MVFKTILNPGDEVIIFSPYFPEYLAYIDNHGGKAIISPCRPDTFEPNIEDLETKITPATKAILLNSPNNPTGAVYSENILNNMAELVHKKKENIQQISLLYQMNHIINWFIATNQCRPY